MENSKKYLFINNFILKIIACITMVLDHVGVFLDMYYGGPEIALAVRILRTIGRISFPLFSFLIVEGALHTKNLKLYLLRIGVMASIIGIALIVIQYGGFLNIGGFSTYNIFLLFTLSLTAILCLNLKKWFKLFSILPFAYVLFIYIIKAIPNSTIINYIPSAFIPDYDLYGFIVIVGSYLLVKLYNSKVKNILSDEETFNAYTLSFEYQIKYNLISLVPLLSLSILSTIFQNINGLEFLNTLNYSLQSYAPLAGIFIILYNGKLGFNNKIVKYGFYLFYPVHIIIIFSIFTILFYI